MEQLRVALFGLIVVCVIVLGLGSYWMTPVRVAATSKVATAGSRTGSGDLVVTGGNVFYDAPGPGVFFGTVRKPGQPTKLSYLVLFKGRPPNGAPAGQSVSSNGGSQGNAIVESNVVTIDGRRLAASHRLVRGEKPDEFVEETLTIDGKSFDPNAGRVFLLDFDAPNPTVRQKNVAPPDLPAAPEGSLGVERAAGAIQAGLRNLDPDVDAFLP